MERFWTITQKSEIQEICRKNGVPQNVEDEIFRVIQILDENYGVGRDIGADGGYIALFLDEEAVTLKEYEAILREYQLKEYHLEFSDVFMESEKREWHSELYIVTNDYGITIIYPHEKKGEHIE